MSLEIAWKQNILVTDSNLLKSLLVVFGFGSQAFICGFSRQKICSVRAYCSNIHTLCPKTTDYGRPERKYPSLHIRQRPHGIKNLDNQIYGLIIIFMASRHVFECEIEYLVVKSCHIWFK